MPVQGEFLESEHPKGWIPQIFPQVPVGFRKIKTGITFPFFKNQDGITFFSQAKSSHTSAKTGTDYNVIIHLLKIAKNSTSCGMGTKEEINCRILARRKV
jgi:hypothetical protein